MSNLKDFRGDNPNDDTVERDRVGQQPQNYTIHTFVRGLNMDTTPFMFSNEGQYTFARNIVIEPQHYNSNVDGSFQDMNQRTEVNGLLTLSNERESVSLDIPELVGRTIVGMCNLSSDIFIFSITYTKHEPEEFPDVFIGINGDYDVSKLTKKSYDVLYVTVDSEIGILDRDNIYTTIYSDRNRTPLNFHINYPIDCTARIGYNERKWLYFTDGLNTPRRIDVDTILNTLQSPSSLDLQDQDTSLLISPVYPECEVVAIIDGGGNLNCGVYQFAARFLTHDLTPTQFGFITEPFPIIDDYSGLPYQSRDGGNWDYPIANRSLSINVSNLDDRYSWVEVAVIRFEGQLLVPTAKLIARRSLDLLNGSNFINLEYTGQEDTKLGIVTVSDILQQSVFYNTAKHLIQKDNRLFLSNLTTSVQPDFTKFVHSLNTKYYVEEWQHNTGFDTGTYKNEFNVYKRKSFRRNEVYSFGILFILKDGTLTDVYHIPGNDKVTTVTTAADTVTKDLGTYVSNEDFTYFDIDSNSFLTTKLTHHVFPTLEQEMHYTTTCAGEVYIRPMFVVIDIEAKLDLNPEIRNSIKGYRVLKQRRDREVNRSVGPMGYLVDVYKSKEVTNTNSDAKFGAFITTSPLFGGVPDIALDTHNNAGIQDHRFAGPILHQRYYREGGVLVDDNYEYMGGKAFYSPDLILPNQYPGISGKLITHYIVSGKASVVHNYGDDFACSFLSYYVDANTDPVPFKHEANINTTVKVNSSPKPTHDCGNYQLGSSMVSFYNGVGIYAYGSEGYVILDVNNIPSIRSYTFGQLGVYPSMGVFKPNCSNSNSIPADFYAVPRLSSTDDVHFRVLIKFDYLNATGVYAGTVIPSDVSHAYYNDDNELVGTINVGNDLYAFTVKVNGVITCYRANNNIPRLYFEESQSDIGTTYIMEENTSTGIAIVRVYFTNSNGHNPQVVTTGLSDYSITSPCSFNSLLPITDISTSYVVATIKKPNNSQYGTIQNSQYSLCTSIREGFTNFYAGDSYISKFSNRTSHTSLGLINESLQNNECRECRMALPTPNDPDAGHRFSVLTHHIYESTLNAELRHTKYRQDATTLQYTPDLNSVYYPKYDAGSVISVVSPKLDQQGYNITYNIENSIKAFTAKSYIEENRELTTFPTRTIYSNMAVQGDRRDLYRKFEPLAFQDLPSNKGEITNQFIHGSKLYLHTDRSLWLTSVNETSQIKDDSGKSVRLGTTGIFEIPAQELIPVDGGYCGCVDKMSCVVTPSTFIFFDRHQKKIFGKDPETGGIVDIGLRGIGLYVKNVVNSRKDAISYVNPDMHSVNSLYDPQNNRILVSFNQSGQYPFIPKNSSDIGKLQDFTVSLSLLTNQWVSFHSTKFNVGISRDLEALCVDKNGILMLNKGKFLPFEIEVLSNLQPYLVKTYDNLTVDMNVFDEGMQYVVDFFDVLRMYTVKDGVLNFPLLLDEDPLVSNVKFVNSQYQLPVPQVDNGIDVPHRIRDKWSKIRFIRSDNPNNLQYLVNFIISKWRFNYR